jgi:hypothetical protein
MEAKAEVMNAPRKTKEDQHAWMMVNKERFNTA